MIDHRHVNAALALIAGAILMPAEALAYTGPGAGISALGSMLALLAAIGFALVGFVWYPVKRLIKSFRKAPAASAGQSTK